MSAKEKPFASESFILTTEKGDKISMRLDLIESSAAHYGNRTCMLMFEDDQFVQQFDTRYEKGCNNPESFREWAFNFAQGHVRKGITIQRS